MRLALFRRPAALAVAVGAAAATTAALQVAGTGTAAACGTPRPSTVPISADAPYDSPASNEWPLTLPAIAPGAGRDFGHLPRWKEYSGGRVLLREDRVTLRRQPQEPGYQLYSNVNPRIRSYWLDPAAAILVYPEQYARMTGRAAPSGEGRHRVTRQQFLDSFNTHGEAWNQWLKYRAVYRLTFDASHTTVVKLEEVLNYYSC